MGQENSPFLKDQIARKEDELTYIADAVDKTASMAPVMHDGLSDTYISTYENLCKTVNISSVKL